MFHISEFLDFQLKPVMQSSKSYIKDSGDFIRKIKDIHYIPSNVVLVLVVLVLYMDTWRKRTSQIYGGFK